MQPTFKQYKFAWAKPGIFVYRADEAQAFQVIAWQIEDSNIVPWCFSGGCFSRLDNTRPTPEGAATYRAERNRIMLMDNDEFIDGVPIAILGVDGDWSDDARQFDEGAILYEMTRQQ